MMQERGRSNGPLTLSSSCFMYSPTCWSRPLLRLCRSSTKSCKGRAPTTCSLTAEQEQKHNERRFMEWLKAEGVRMADVELSSFGGIRGVRARSDLVCGETLVSLPRKLTLCVGNHQPCPFPQYVSAKFWQQSSMHVRLALRLLFEMQREDSRFAPWLCLLPPSHADKACRWTEERIELLAVRTVE